VGATLPAEHPDPPRAALFYQGLKLPDPTLSIHERVGELGFTLAHVLKLGGQRLGHEDQGGAGLGHGLASIGQGARRLPIVVCKLAIFKGALYRVKASAGGRHVCNEPDQPKVGIGEPAWRTRWGEGMW